jgi:rusticyanin
VEPARRRDDDIAFQGRDEVDLMTITDRTSSAHPPAPSARRPLRGVLVAAAAVALLAVGAALGWAAARDDDSPAADFPGAAPSAMRVYYDAMMGRNRWGHQMMGGTSPEQLRGDRGFAWMMGGAHAPGWMHGGSLPRMMMMGNADPGTVMGRLFADAPGDRVSPAQAAALGEQVPPGAVADVEANTLTFTGPTVDLAVIAASAHSFRVAGMTNPTISVRVGSTVTLTFVNADDDTAHGLVVTATEPPYAPMPMMTAAPAFTGAAVWFLGDPTAQGMHESTITFTAAESGSYRYLCPVPGHARAGMVGVFAVTAA